jgi:hypothetical protein
MPDITRILAQIESGEPQAAEQLLPVVYDELRKLAAAKLAGEKPGQTLEATALVNEAYLRLVGGEQVRHWDSSGPQRIPAADAEPLILRMREVFCVPIPHCSWTTCEFRHDQSAAK